LQEQLFTTFEKKFGKYGLNLVLRHADKKPVRHAIEHRVMTMPFYVMQDVRQLVDAAKQELEVAESDAQDKQIFDTLLAHLRELFYDHFIDQAGAEPRFWNLADTFVALEDTLSNFQRRLRFYKTFTGPSAPVPSPEPRIKKVKRSMAPYSGMDMMANGNEAPHAGDEDILD